MSKFVADYKKLFLFFRRTLHYDRFHASVCSIRFPYSLQLRPYGYETTEYIPSQDVLSVSHQYRWLSKDQESGTEYMDRGSG